MVRTALHVDPETAQVTAVSDPLPTILARHPARPARRSRVDVDRPDFTLNPTSCDPMAVDGHADLGPAAQSANALQPLPGRRLRAPRLQARSWRSSLKGGTKRGGYPALTRDADSAKPGDANIGRASVALPHSEFLAQDHIQTICTRVQFAAEQPARTARSTATPRRPRPLLDQPLEGPGLPAQLHQPAARPGRSPCDGQIDVDLVGRIDSVNGGIRNTFESVPDAPVSKFVLTMQGGKKGLLENSRNLCKSHQPGRA